MKKLLFLSALFLIGAASFGQVKFGVNAGLNLSKIGQNFKDPANEFKTKLNPGFRLGLAINYEIGESLDLITGLNYTQKGFSLDLEDGLASGETVEGYDRFNLGYLEVPINVAYKLKNFRFMAGPYVAFGVNGKNKWDYKYSFNGQVFEDADEDSNYKFKNKLGEKELNDNNSYTKAVDFGLNIGVGYDINGILINANYGLGLSNLVPKTDVAGVTDDSKDFKMTNRVISIGATYFFGG